MYIQYFSLQVQNVLYSGLFSWVEIFVFTYDSTYNSVLYLCVLYLLFQRSRLTEAINHSISETPSQNPKVSRLI